jgi:hypothetical protein
VWVTLDESPNKGQSGLHRLFNQEIDVSREYVECTEIAGKTVKTLKIYEDDIDGCETLIEFTDGTSFSSSVSNQPTVKGTLFVGGAGTPKIIRDYEP